MSFVSEFVADYEHKRITLEMKMTQIPSTFVGIKSETGADCISLL